MEANSQAENSLCVRGTEAVEQDIHRHSHTRERTRTCNLATAPSAERGLNAHSGDSRGDAELPLGCKIVPIWKYGFVNAVQRLGI